MSDSNLIAFGCAIFFIAFYGVYSYVRAQYAYNDMVDAPENRPNVVPRESLDV